MKSIPHKPDYHTSQSWRFLPIPSRTLTPQIIAAINRALDRQDDLEQARHHLRLVCREDELERAVRIFQTFKRIGGKRITAGGEA